LKIQPFLGVFEDFNRWVL